MFFGDILDKEDFKNNLFDQNTPKPFGLGSPLDDQSEKEKRITKVKSKMEAESELQDFIAMKSSISNLSSDAQNRMAILAVKNDNQEGQSSVNDSKLGSNENARGRGLTDKRCGYCGFNKCPGHCAIIRFDSPIYNPTVIRLIVKLLTIFCNTCGSLLISKETIREKGFHLLSVNKKLKEMETYCKTGISCLRKKDGITKSCGKNPEYISSSVKTEGIIKYKVSTSNGKKNPGVSIEQERTAEDALKILSIISSEDVDELGIGLQQHPKDFILSGILVPPPITRPILYEGDNNRPNHITTGLINLYKVTQNVGKTRNTSVYKELHALIYGSSTKKKGSQQQFIISMIQGKRAIIRSHFMGKRVNNSARTVASPDDSLNFGEIGVPMVWAAKLPKRVRITSFNIDYLRNLQERGRITHYITKKGGFRQQITPNTKLEIGNQVDRFLEDGDILCVNRQPTLHKYSLIACIVKLGDHKTINLHLSYTPGMNCDFDGDECNLWNVQDEEAEVELQEIINVKCNIISTAINKPIVTLVLNSILGSYLLTDNRTIIEENTFQALINIISSREDIESLNDRLQMNGIHKRSGRALMSALFPADFFYSFFEGGEEIFTIYNGVILNPISSDKYNLKQARIYKKILSTADGSIIHAMHKKYGSERVSRFLTDTPKVINKWLPERGFSVGIKDCISIGYDEDGNEYDRNLEEMKSIIEITENTLKELGGKLEDPLEEDFRRQRINEAVDKASTAGKVIAKKSFTIDNAFRDMTDEGSGAKGGIGNIGQMYGMIGQQYIQGERPEPLLRGNRLNICRDKNDLSAEANGFIKESFEEGVNPTGLFNLMAGGRPGLLDTALNTSTTGTISKKMSKAQENIIIYSDFTVRNTIGNLFLPSFNCGYRTDAVVQVKSKNNIVQTSFINIPFVINEINGKRGFIKENLTEGISRGILENKEERESDPILGRNSKIGFVPHIATHPFVEKKTGSANSKIDKYEKTRIIGTRVKQLTNNAIPYIDVKKFGYTKAIDIAKHEFEEGLLDIFAKYFGACPFTPNVYSIRPAL